MISAPCAGKDEVRMWAAAAALAVCAAGCSKQEAAPVAAAPPPVATPVPRAVPQAIPPPADYQPVAVAPRKERVLRHKMEASDEARREALRNYSQSRLPKPVSP